ncbi:MAG TPA: amino acid ABC transporter permease [Acidimicrobiia bacterium]|nr:amino acid ABC transporter permease [Acidimicrobiia bacterium]
MTTDVEAIDAALQHRAERGRFPWWLVVMLAIIGWLGYLVFFDERFTDARTFILPGLVITIRATLFAFALAVVIGLVAGLGRISRFTPVRHLCITYVEFIRGVPILVLILMVAFVVIPPIFEAVGLANRLSFEMRAVLSLALIYGGYIAEVFRAGIESVPPGQAEAGRSLGLTQGKTMRYIVLPQAIRNVLPALGNDFISMLKDSSLLTLLGVGEITHKSRLYSGSSFKYPEAFLTITFLYLCMTLVLSLVVRAVSRRLDRG